MNEIMIERFDAWASALFTTEIPVDDSFRENLKAIILREAALQDTPIQSEVAVAAKHGLKESPLNFLELDDEPVQQLKAFIEQAVLYAAFEANADYWPEDVEYQTRIVESWYHVTEEGGYHDVHSHPNCSWCGIYCVDQGDVELSTQNGVNRFYDPRSNAGHYQDVGTQYLNQEGFWDIAPQNGGLTLFPSYLKHSALPYRGDKSRIVIAFNCQIVE